MFFGSQEEGPKSTNSLAVVRRRCNTEIFILGRKMDSPSCLPVQELFRMSILALERTKHMPESNSTQESLSMALERPKVLVTYNEGDRARKSRNVT